jgi:hypothetical protein
LPHIATKVPAGAQAESRVKRFARWVRNDRSTEEVYFVPSAQVLLAHLALQTLALIMDGSVVGRGCVAFMIHVVYQGRALPLAWHVRTGKKGHVPEDRHIALVQQVYPLISLGASVVLLGDGEFDGTTLQHTVQGYQWSYVGRTGSHLTVLWDGECVRCETVAACSKPGTLVALTDVRVTEAAYGPVMLLCCWATGYQEPLHLLTHLASADAACRLYAKRFRIECNFRDAKQYWGLEDFMNVTPTGVTNAANLPLFMVNVAYRLRADGQARDPDTDYSVLDLKTDCRAYKYVEETIKMLPEKPEPVLFAKILNQVAGLGRIHASQPSFSFS